MGPRNTGVRGGGWGHGNLSNWKRGPEELGADLLGESTASGWWWFTRSEAPMEMGCRCTALGEGTSKLPRASLRAVRRLLLGVHQQSREWNPCPRQALAGANDRNCRQTEKSRFLFLLPCWIP